MRRPPHYQSSPMPLDLPSGGGSSSNNSGSGHHRVHSDPTLGLRTSPVSHNININPTSNLRIGIPHSSSAGSLGAGSSGSVSGVTRSGQYPQQHQHHHIRTFSGGDNSNQYNVSNSAAQRTSPTSRRAAGVSGQSGSSGGSNAASGSPTWYGAPHAAAVAHGGGGSSAASGSFGYASGYPSGARSDVGGVSPGQWNQLRSKGRKNFAEMLSTLDFDRASGGSDVKQNYFRQPKARPNMPGQELEELQEDDDDNMFGHSGGFGGSGGGGSGMNANRRHSDANDEFIQQVVHHRPRKWVVKRASGLATGSGGNVFGANPPGFGPSSASATNVYTGTRRGLLAPPTTGVFPQQQPQQQPFAVQQSSIISGGGSGGNIVSGVSHWRRPSSSSTLDELGQQQPGNAHGGSPTAEISALEPMQTQRQSPGQQQRKALTWRSNLEEHFQNQAAFTPTDQRGQPLQQQQGSPTGGTAGGGRRVEAPPPPMQNQSGSFTSGGSGTYSPHQPPQKSASDSNLFRQQHRRHISDDSNDVEMHPLVSQIERNRIASKQLQQQQQQKEQESLQQQQQLQRTNGIRGLSKDNGFPSQKRDGTNTRTDTFHRSAGIPPDEIAAAAQRPSVRYTPGSDNPTHLIPWASRVPGRESLRDSCDFCRVPHFWARTEWTVRVIVLGFLPTVAMMLDEDTSKLFFFPSTLPMMVAWIMSPRLGNAVEKSITMLKSWCIAAIISMPFVLLDFSAGALTDYVRYFIIMFLMVIMIMVYMTGVSGGRDTVFFFVGIWLDKLYSPKKFTDHEFAYFYYTYLRDVVIGLCFGVLPCLLPRPLHALDRAKGIIASLANCISISAQGTCESIWTNSTLERELSAVRLHQLRLLMADHIEATESLLSAAAWEPHSNQTVASVKARFQLLKSMASISNSANTVIDKLCSDVSLVQDATFQRFGFLIAEQLRDMMSAFDNVMFRLVDWNNPINDNDIYSFKTSYQEFLDAVYAARVNCYYRNIAALRDIGEVDIVVGFVLFSMEELFESTIGFTEPVPTSSKFKDLTINAVTGAAIHLWKRTLELPDFIMDPDKREHSISALKLAFCITFSGLISPVTKNFQRELADTSVIAFLHRGTGASFRYASQRMQGIVFAAVVAYMISGWSGDQFGVFLILIILLLTMCCFVFTSKSWSVSGDAGNFTVVNMVQPGKSSFDALVRIQQNVLAIIIYTVVFNTLWPVLSTDAMRDGLQGSLRAFRIAACSMLTQLQGMDRLTAEELESISAEPLRDMAKCIDMQRTNLIPATAQPTLTGTSFAEQHYQRLISMQQTLYHLLSNLVNAYRRIKAVESDLMSHHNAIVQDIVEPCRALADLIFGIVDLLLLLLQDVSSVPTKQLVKFAMHIKDISNLLTVRYRESLRSLMESVNATDPEVLLGGDRLSSSDGGGGCVDGGNESGGGGGGGGGGGAALPAPNATAASGNVGVYANADGDDDDDDADNNEQQPLPETPHHPLRVSDLEKLQRLQAKEAEEKKRKDKEAADAAAAKQQKKKKEEAAKAVKIAEKEKQEREKKERAEAEAAAPPPSSPALTARGGSGVLNASNSGGGGGGGDNIPPPPSPAATQAPGTEERDRQATTTRQQAAASTTTSNSPAQPTPAAKQTQREQQEQLRAATAATAQQQQQQQFIDALGSPDTPLSPPHLTNSYTQKLNRERLLGILQSPPSPASAAGTHQNVQQQQQQVRSSSSGSSKQQQQQNFYSDMTPPSPLSSLPTAVVDRSAIASAGGVFPSNVPISNNDNDNINNATVPQPQSPKAATATQEQLQQAFQQGPPSALHASFSASSFAPQAGGAAAPPPDVASTIAPSPLFPAGSRNFTPRSNNAEFMHRSVTDNNNDHFRGGSGEPASETSDNTNNTARGASGQQRQFSSPNLTAASPGAASNTAAGSPDGGIPAGNSGLNATAAPRQQPQQQQAPQPGIISSAPPPPLTRRQGSNSTLHSTVNDDDDDGNFHLSRSSDNDTANNNNMDSPSASRKLGATQQQRTSSSDKTNKKKRPSPGEEDDDETNNKKTMRSSSSGGKKKGEQDDNLSKSMKRALASGGGGVDLDKTHSQLNLAPLQRKPSGRVRPGIASPNLKGQSGGTLGDSQTLNVPNSNHNNNDNSSAVSGASSRGAASTVIPTNDGKSNKGAGTAGGGGGAGLDETHTPGETTSQQPVVSLALQELHRERQTFRRRPPKEVLEAMQAKLTQAAASGAAPRAVVEQVQQKAAEAQQQHVLHQQAAAAARAAAGGGGSGDGGASGSGGEEEVQEEEFEVHLDSRTVHSLEAFVFAIQSMASELVRVQQTVIEMEHFDELQKASVVT